MSPFADGVPGATHDRGRINQTFEIIIQRYGSCCAHMILDIDSSPREWVSRAFGTSWDRCEKRERHVNTMVQAICDYGVTHLFTLSNIYLFRRHGEQSSLRTGSN